MKNFTLFTILSIVLFLSACGASATLNTSAVNEQNATEQNQRGLNAVQPPPKISWSLERDNLIKRFKLQNDRAVTFFMYVFIEGVADPIGYYQVNKVSSVNSQLTNTEQIVRMRYPSGYGSEQVLPSPAEDGSYGTNGDAVFGFTPEDIYLEHNLKYITSTVPLTFNKPINRLAIITPEGKVLLEQTKKAMNSSVEPTN